MFRILQWLKKTTKECSGSVPYFSWFLVISGTTLRALISLSTLGFMHKHFHNFFWLYVFQQTFVTTATYWCIRDISTKYKSSSHLCYNVMNKTDSEMTWQRQICLYKSTLHGAQCSLLNYRNSFKWWCGQGQYQKPRTGFQKGQQLNLIKGWF